MACIIASLIVIIGGIAVISELVYQKHRAAQLEMASSERPAAQTLRDKLETPVVIGQQQFSKSSQKDTNSTDEDKKTVDTTEETVVEHQKQETKDAQVTPGSENQGGEGAHGEVNTPVVVNNGRKVAIDAGHQAKGNSEQEPIGPGASETKPKVASGTHGDASGLDEYQLNLTVSLKLRDELVKRGYEVYMVRETHEVDISNKERAELAAASGSDILVRIHANGDTNTSISGALTMAPSGDNPYLSRDLITRSTNLSQEIITGFCQATGAKNLGVQGYNNMSGINWTQIPVTIVEMGFMSNQDDDLHMADDVYQNKMVQGIANGIDAYYQLP